MFNPGDKVRLIKNNTKTRYTYIGIGDIVTIDKYLAEGGYSAKEFPDGRLTIIASMFELVSREKPITLSEFLEN